MYYFSCYRKFLFGTSFWGEGWKRRGGGGCWQKCLKVVIKIPTKLTPFLTVDSGRQNTRIYIFIWNIVSIKQKKSAIGSNTQIPFAARRKISTSNKMKLFNLFLITSQPAAATTAPAATAEEIDNGRIARHIIPFLLLGAVIWEGEKERDRRAWGERESGVDEDEGVWRGRSGEEGGWGEGRVFRQDVNIAVAIIFPISFTWWNKIARLPMQ